MSPQIQRGIPLIVLPLPSERVGERLFFSSLLLLKYNGVSRFLLPSPFGEGSGERLLRVCFRLYEIPLQTVRCYCSQINSLSLKTVFVTYRESIGYKENCKRCPFALQNMPFYTPKDALLHCKRASFTIQKGMYYLPTANSSYIRWASLRVNQLITQQVHCTIPHIQQRSSCPSPFGERTSMRLLVAMTRHPFTSPSLSFRG